MTTLKKRYPIGMRWNGPTMDDLYLLLTKSAEDRVLGSRVPRGRVQKKEKSEYHPELWPVMPTFFSGFHDHQHENVVG
ncbi:unnamed protein product [Toxocara canis]|nr:unnamed protein product [Toxocara canis]